MSARQPSHNGDICKAKHRKRAGFSLFEAIVAITLLGVALVPILVLLSQSAAMLNHAGEANERSFLRLSVLQLMEAVNPLERPTGEVDLVGFRVSWEATELEPASQPEARTAGLRGYDLGWYALDVSVHNEERDLIDRIRLEKTGYRRLTNQNFAVGLN